MVRRFQGPVASNGASPLMDCPPPEGGPSASCQCIYDCEYIERRYEQLAIFSLWFIPLKVASPRTLETCYPSGRACRLRVCASSTLG